MTACPCSCIVVRSKTVPTESLNRSAGSSGNVSSRPEIPHAATTEIVGPTYYPPALMYVSACRRWEVTVPYHTIKSEYSFLYGLVLADQFFDQK